MLENKLKKGKNIINNELAGPNIIPNKLTLVVMKGNPSKYRYFFKLSFLAILMQVFLFTKLANFLSIIPSFSFGNLFKRSIKG